MNARYPAILTSLTMALAGCASTPPLTVDTHGTLPSPAILERPDGRTPATALEQDILTQLAAKGFTSAEHGAVLVQVTSALTTGKTGLFVPEDNHGAAPRWLVAPSASRSVDMRVVTVTLSDRTTGKELYRVVATEPRRKGKPQTDERITQAILARFDTARPPSPSS